MISSLCLCLCCVGMSVTVFHLDLTLQGLRTSGSLHTAPPQHSNRCSSMFHSLPSFTLNKPTWVCHSWCHLPNYLLNSDLGVWLWFWLCYLWGKYKTPQSLCSLVTSNWSSLEFPVIFSSIHPMKHFFPIHMLFTYVFGYYGVCVCVVRDQPQQMDLSPEWRCGRQMKIMKHRNI